MSALVVSLFSVLLVVVTGPLISAGPSGTKCPPAPGRPETCVCEPFDQFVVDVTPYSNTNGTARYTYNVIASYEVMLLVT